MPALFLRSQNPIQTLIVGFDYRRTIRLISIDRERWGSRVRRQPFEGSGRDLAEQADVTGRDRCKNLVQLGCIQTELAPKQPPQHRAVFIENRKIAVL